MPDMKKDSIGRLISFINRLSQKKLAKMLKPYDLGFGGHHSYLKAILRQPGVNQDQLTNDLKFDKATTTRSVAQLEAAGYIERRIDPNDRRSYLLYPTERALGFEPKLHTILEELNRELTRSLSDEEKEQLLRLLQKIYADHID